MYFSCSYFHDEYVIYEYRGTNSAQFAKASASTAKTIEPITISLTATHKMYLNEREIRPDDLGNEIQGIVAKEPQQAFIVRASEDIAYKDVISILDNLKMSGARFVSVATERK